MKPYISMLKVSDKHRELVYDVIKEPMKSGTIYVEANGTFFVHDVTKKHTDMEWDAVRYADVLYSEIAWKDEASGYRRDLKERTGELSPMYDEYVEGIQRLIFRWIDELDKPVVMVSNKKNMQVFIESALSAKPDCEITLLESKILGARCYVGFFNICKEVTAYEISGTDKITDDTFLYEDMKVKGYLTMTDLREWMHNDWSSLYDFSCGFGNSFGNFNGNRLRNVYGSDINGYFTEFCRRYWGRNETDLIS